MQRREGHSVEFQNIYKAKDRLKLFYKLAEHQKWPKFTLLKVCHGYTSSNSDTLYF